MSRYFEIRWHGRGGQGTVTGAKTLAKVVQCTGRSVEAFPEYGPERRGAPIRAFNRFADHEIRIHTPVQQPDVVIVVDASLIGAPSITEGIAPDTVFIVNTEKPAKDVKDALGLTSQKVYTVPANAISRALFGREIPNSAVIGAFARAVGNIVTIDTLLKETGEAFTEMLGADLVQKNMEALKQGYEKGDAA